MFQKLQTATDFESVHAVPKELGVIRVEIYQVAKFEMTSESIFGTARVPGSYRKFPVSTLDKCSHETV